MKKKILNIVIALCLMLTSVFMLSACNEKEEYQITIINGLKGGKILPDVETGTKSVQVEHGDNYSVMIIPDDGYKVAGLLIDGQIIEKDSNETIVYTFENILTDHSIAGVFEQIEPTIKSMKLEGFKITYEESSSCSFYSIDINQNLIQSNGYGFIYSSGNSSLVHINNAISRDSGKVIDNVRSYKFGKDEIANNVVFFDDCARLDIYCDMYSQSATSSFGEIINLKSTDLRKIESSIYEDIYSYTIQNTNSNSMITSIELIFTVVAWTI